MLARVYVEFVCACDEHFMNVYLLAVYILSSREDIFAWENRGVC